VGEEGPVHGLRSYMDLWVPFRLRDRNRSGVERDERDAVEVDDETDERPPSFCGPPVDS